MPEDGGGMEDLIPAIVTADWRMLNGLYGLNPLFGHQTAVLVHFPGNLVGNRPFIKNASGPFRQSFPCFRQIPGPACRPFQFPAVFSRKWLYVLIWL